MFPGVSGLSGKSAKPDFSAHAQSLFDQAISFIDTPKKFWPIVLKLYRWVLRLGGGQFKYLTHYNLGRLLHEDGKYEEAAKHYRRAIELKPDYYVAYNNLGIVLCLMGRYEESEAAYCQALEIKDYFNPHNNLADLYLRLGRLEEAKAEVRIALRMKPDSIAPVHTYAQVLAKLGRFGEAEEWFRRGLVLESDDVAVLEDFSEFLARRHRDDEAVKHRTRAHKLKDAQKRKCDGLQEWRDRSEVYSQRNRGKKKHVSQ
jgi:tetratricopeptide (TPR) repeat protein